MFSNQQFDDEIQTMEDYLSSEKYCSIKTLQYYLRPKMKQSILNQQLDQLEAKQYFTQGLFPQKKYYSLEDPFDEQFSIELKEEKKLLESISLKKMDTIYTNNSILRNKSQGNTKSTKSVTFKLPEQSSTSSYTTTLRDQRRIMLRTLRQQGKKP